MLLGWASDQPVGSFAEAGEILELFFVASGTFVVLIGCMVFCVKGQARRLVLAGSVASAACLLLIPALASLAHFDPNVHDWTGLLFFLWLLSCLVGPAILIVGVIRFLLCIIARDSFSARLTRCAEFIGVEEFADFGGHATLRERLLKKSKGLVRRTPRTQVPLTHEYPLVI